MSQLLGTQAPFLSDLNLLFQILLLILVTVAIRIGITKTALNLEKHHRFASGIIVLNILSVFLVMIPTVIRSFEYGGPQASSFPHFIFGSLVILLSLIVIFKKFDNIKTIMRIFAIMWIIVFISGSGLFFRFFVR